MAYLGNLKGPRESEIVQTLGHEYFGITPAELDSDIRMFEDSERRNEIQPVYLDTEGRPYILLSRPRVRPERFFLHEHGWLLEGDIVTRIEETQ